MKHMTCKLLSLFLVLLLALSGMALAEETALTLTDQVGREVMLDAPAEKLVSCYYISTASLIALGLEDNLVGIEMKADTRGLYQLAAPQIIELPAVGSGKGINVEEIAALAPDLVILPKKLQAEAETLATLGIDALVVNPETLADFEACITLLGQATGKEQAAELLLARYQATTQAVQEAVKDSQPVRVYLAAGSDYLTTYPTGLYQNDLIAIAGGENVAAELTGDSKAQIDAEQLLAWDPEYIFYVSDAEYTAEDILSDPALAELTAVKEEHVYPFPSAIEAWDYPTPSSVLGQVYLASVLHPQAVSAETFLAEAQSFYKDVFAVDVTLEDMGIQ